MNNKVTGLGGVFFKVNNPEKTREWYKEHLGIESEIWGAQFPWRNFENPDEIGNSLWNPFKMQSTYFEPSDKPFMINYIVENLVELLEELKQQGVEALGKMHEDEFGKFAWIMDPDGQKLELWEPPKA